jgi:hypothetical protein
VPARPPVWRERVSLAPPCWLSCGAGLMSTPCDSCPLNRRQGRTRERHPP